MGRLPSNYATNKKEDEVRMVGEIYSKGNNAQRTLLCFNTPVSSVTTSMSPLS